MSETAEDRFRNFDFNKSKEWLNYFSNLEIVDGYMSNTTLEKYKRKWYSKNIEEISLTPTPKQQSTTSQQQPTTSSSNSNNNNQSNANTSSSSSTTNNTANTTTRNSTTTTAVPDRRVLLISLLSFLVVVFGIFGLLSVLFGGFFTPTLASTSPQTTIPPSVNINNNKAIPNDDGFMDEFEDSEMTTTTQPVMGSEIVTEQRSFLGSILYGFFGFCSYSYQISIFLTIIIFVMELFSKYKTFTKVFTNLMFDADGQYFFISLFFIFEKNFIFLILILISNIVRFINNFLIILQNSNFNQFLQNNNAMNENLNKIKTYLIMLQNSINRSNLGDVFAKFELFLLFNEVLHFSIFKIIIMFNFICHRYLIFNNMKVMIHFIKNNYLDVYIPNVLRGVYLKIVEYISKYVNSLEVKMNQVRTQTN
ncbi:hypothetical protein ABK040_016458 [Willaertia magna]